MPGLTPRPVSPLRSGHAVIATMPPNIRPTLNGLSTMSTPASSPRNKSSTTAFSIPFMRRHLGT